MSQTYDISLCCINHNHYLLSVCDDQLILETSTKLTKENTVWTVTSNLAPWTLVHRASSIHLNFDTERKLISSSKENDTKSSKSLKVKNGDHDLLLQLSSTVSTTADNKLSLEVLFENDSNSKAYSVFFIYEEFCTIAPHLDSKSFGNQSTKVKTIADLNDNYYDYVVIGSGFCALAFIHQTLLNNPKAKILVLEKGWKYLSEHHQHSTSTSSPGEVESRPWTISHETRQNQYVKNVHGQIALFGGRSNYWSGWSPIPSSEELSEWPEDLKTTLEKTYFNRAKQFLRVVAANKIDVREDNNLLYDGLQSWLKEQLDSTADIESVQQILHAPLAMGNNRAIKFSTVGTLLSKKNVTVLFNCTVEKILHHEKKPTALQTSHGVNLPLKGSKLILAMSTLPATTLVLNSFNKTEFPQLSNVGQRFTAHFVSSVIARVPRPNLSLADNVELGAIYIAGMKEKAQYHLQLSGVTYKQCTDDRHIHDICKKYSANSIPRECVDTSQDFVVVSCSTLGELDYKNKNNQFNLINNGQCLTTNGELKYCFNNQDQELWDLMDSVTFKVMKKLSCSANSDDLEYWHETNKAWMKDIPSSEQIRKKSFVHDASTMWIGSIEDSEAPVGLDYRLKGVDNVYITGGALWPTGGSWNPVLTIVAMAMHLADTITKSEPATTDKKLSSQFPMYIM